MRYMIRIITLTFILSTAPLTGCGSNDTGPTPVNVNAKEDARIKADFEQALKNKKTQTAVPAK